MVKQKATACTQLLLSRFGAVVSMQVKHGITCPPTIEPAKGATRPDQAGSVDGSPPWGQPAKALWVRLVVRCVWSAPGLGSFLAVLVFRYPHWLTASETAPRYPIETMRVILALAIIASFLLSALNILLRPSGGSG